MYCWILSKLLFFLSSTIFDIEVSNYVEFCRKLCTLYTIYIPQCIAYNIYSLCILHTLLLYPCIQYTFYYVYNIFSFIYLTRYILYVLRTLFLITYIPYICNCKHEKNYFLFFCLTYGLKCAFLYTYFYPLVKH